MDAKRYTQALSAALPALTSDLQQCQDTAPGTTDSQHHLVDSAILSEALRTALEMLSKRSSGKA
jgi:hypothetical protein